ncbi:hypothetical protein NBRC116494_17600 [Aurantivibrio plasticivorans]
MNDLNPTAPTSTSTSEMIQLEKFSDDAIKSLIAEGYKLLDSRKRKREKEVREQIKELAASEGIKVSFREPSVRRKRSTTIESN